MPRSTAAAPRRSAAEDLSAALDRVLTSHRPADLDRATRDLMAAYRSGEPTTAAWVAGIR